ASGKREEFLVRTRTECPLADDRSALVIGKCRNDRFGGSGCIDIRDDSRFALKDDLRRVGGICLRDLIVFSDLGRQCAVADKEICDLYAFFEAAAGNRTKVKYDLLHSLLGKRTDRLADLVRIAFVERNHLYDAGLPGFDLCFRSRRLRIAASYGYCLRLFTRAKDPQCHGRPRIAFDQMDGIVELYVPCCLCTDILDDIAVLNARLLSRASFRNGKNVQIARYGCELCSDT